MPARHDPRGRAPPAIAISRRDRGGFGRRVRPEEVASLVDRLSARGRAPQPYERVPARTSTRRHRRFPHARQGERRAARRAEPQAARRPPRLPALVLGQLPSRRHRPRAAGARAREGRPLLQRHHLLTPARSTKRRRSASARSSRRRTAAASRARSARSSGARCPRASPSRRSRTGRQLGARGRGASRAPRTGRSPTASAPTSSSSALLPWDIEFEKKIAALTPEQVIAALHRHIDPARLAVLSPGDLKKPLKTRTDHVFRAAWPRPTPADQRVPLHGRGTFARRIQREMS